MAGAGAVYKSRLSKFRSGERVDYNMCVAICTGGRLPRLVLVQCINLDLVNFILARK